MASIDPWTDFELVRSTVARNTVDKLKQIILGLSDECGVHLQKTGKKQELIDRILAVLDNWKVHKTADKWVKAKQILTSVSTRGVYTGNHLTAASTSLASHAMSGANYGSTSNYAQSTALPAARYDPYAPPRRPSGSIPGLPTTTLSSTLTASKPLLRFKESPFFTIDQPVSPVVECPESNSSTDRRQQTVVFTLSPDQIAKLKSANPKYQLRLFCTSSTFYSPNPSFRSNSAPSLMEFPPTCEVRVNNVQLSANLKGLKKKPGTAPPPDLGKYIRVNNTGNKVEMVYVNSQQPVLSKKFYLVAMLVKTVTIDSLVEKLKVNSFTSTETVLAKMRAALNDDDDIISGPQKMSLKCPLSFMRVNTPCRSSKCVHPQCFDATSWFSMMEQTTTWLCPVCEKSLDTNDLIIDGYFDSILKQCPDSVEDVFVEADGEWHTSDSKYGSANWKILHPPTKPISLPPTPRKPPSFAKSSSQCNAKPNGKSKADPSIVILDSDDEEEDRVKQELSPSFGSSQAPSVPPSLHSDVIDLTLDSDDEDSPPPYTRQAGKRKASEPPSPTETIWKKSRGEDDRTGASSSTYPRLDPLPPLDGAFTIRYGMHSTSTVQPLQPISGASNGRYMDSGYSEPEEPWQRLRISRAQGPW